MKTEDIKLPHITTDYFGEYTNLWELLKELTLSKNAVSAFNSSKRIEEFLEKEMKKYAIEAVKLNSRQPQSATEHQPFDLEAAKRGEPLVTRDGRKAKFVAYVPEAEDYPVISIVEGGTTCSMSRNDGGYYKNEKHPEDLFMAPKPMRTVYVNFYRGPTADVYTTERNARTDVGSWPIAIAVPVQIPA